MESRSSVVFSVSVALFVVASVFVFLRIISRSLIVRRIGWDDYFMILAWFLGFGLAFSACYAASVGLGRHRADIPAEWHGKLKKAEYAFAVLYNPSLMAFKTSILVFYFTLGEQQKFFRMLVVVTLAVVNIAGLALTFLNIFQCRPLSASFSWNTPADAHCTDIVTLYLSSSPVNIITDLAILFLPMPILTGMRLPKKQKIILILTFSMGFFSCAVDVVRVAYIQQSALSRLQLTSQSSNGTTKTASTSDFSWYASPTFAWSVVEVCVGMACGCVPSLKPLVARFLPSILHGSGEYSKSSSARLRQLDLEASAGAINGHQLPTIAGVVLSNSCSRSQDPQGSGSDSLGLSTFFEPEPSPMTPVHQITTATTTRHSSPQNSTFFDFVNVKRPRCLLKLSNRESVFPMFTVNVLFFLWGFAYGLLDSLNSQFQLIANMSEWQNLALHGAYFAGYAGALFVGRPILSRFGFKVTFIIGLCIYAIGALMFWPSAVLTSFTAFIFSNVITGLGLSALEVAANPFIALCGPYKYAETRLNLSQGIQAVGTVLSPLLANKVLFKNYLDAPSLINSQWTYLGIALFDVVLAVVFYYLPIPEASDEELKEFADRRESINKKPVCGIPVIYVTLALGVFSQFCYVSGQEAVNMRFADYIETKQPNLSLSSLDYQAIGHAVFAMGRFLCAFLTIFVPSPYVLLVSYAGLLCVSTLAMNVSGDTAIAITMLIYLFEAGIFSIIFCTCLRGLGARTKFGSGLVIAAVSGGAVTPVIMNAVAISRGIGYSFCTIVATFAFGAIYPIYLCIVPAARHQVDTGKPEPKQFFRSLTPSKQESNEKSSKRQMSGIPFHEHVDLNHQNH